MKTRNGPKDKVIDGFAFHSLGPSGLLRLVKALATGIVAGKRYKVIKKL
jgi:hypothetical protein